MSMSTTECATLLGLEAIPVQVEARITESPPGLHIVSPGLPEEDLLKKDTVTRETCIRIQSALAHLGLGIHTHSQRIDVTLTLRKTSCDLAIAVAILRALGKLPDDGGFFLGDLALDGRVQPVRGVLPQLLAARDRGCTKTIVPVANAYEASEVEGLDVRTVRSLAELLEGELPSLELTRMPARQSERVDDEPVDMADLRGMPEARRALEIAAAGAHSLLFLGPPGAGKTMLARRLPGILPRLTPAEHLEMASVHSVAGLLTGRLWRRRPFRAPHHTVSEAGLVGANNRPGEVSLAHHGVLFLDELAEFRRSTLEALRRPLDEGIAQSSIELAGKRRIAGFPSRALLVGATNPCPCGYQGDGTNRCRCEPKRIEAYRARLDVGPDFDLRVRLSPVDVASLKKGTPDESSATVRGRVERAQEMRATLRATSRVGGFVPAYTGPSLPAREYAKALRVARTIADLDHAPDVLARHIDEALLFVRRPER